MNIVLRPLSFVLAAAAIAAAADPATNAPPPAAATNGAATVKSPIVTRGVMASRTPGMRGKLLARGELVGGDAVVMRALRWLKTVQCEDGSWPGHPVVSTALAVWSYLDHNEAPTANEGDEFGPTVQRALEFLAADVDPESGLFRSARGEPLAQPIGALALAMGYGASRNPYIREDGPSPFRQRLREAGESALRPIVAGQRPDGAWNADPLEPSPKGRDDPRSTVWCALALGGGRRWTYISSPPPERQRAADALAAFLARAPDSAPVDPAMAVAVHGLQQLGGYAHPAVGKAASLFERTVFSWEAWDGPQPWNASDTPVRDWFFVTKALFEEGGKALSGWNKQFLPEVIARQTVLPAEESGYLDLRGRPLEIGWWDSPSDAEREICSGGPVLPCKRWRGGECLDGETTLGDRVRDTCLSAIPMMVYYAPIPTYQSAGDHESLTIPSIPPRPTTNDAVRIP